MTRDPKKGPAGVAMWCAAVALLVFGCGSLWAQQPRPVAPPKAAGQSATEVESYWTKDRMNAARPAPMPRPDAAKGKVVRPGAGTPADDNGLITKPQGE